MNKKKRIVLVIWLCIVLVCFNGCSGSDAIEGTDTRTESKEPTYKKIITIAPSLDFTGMDVQNENGAEAKSVYLMVFDTLVDYDTMKEEYIPGLAESWERISDTLWEFKIRKGVKFHDGNELTAKDVKFTIERGLNNSASKSKFSSIKKVDIIDDYTVHFELHAPDYDLVYKLCEPNTVILSENAFATLGDEEGNKIGTGPFMYKEWVVGDYLSLERFEDYWDGAKKTEEMIIRNIPEASSRLIALQTGEIDVCIDPPVVDLHYIVDDENLELWQIPSTNIRHIILNLNVEPFTNKLVRQAVAHAIDRDSLVAMVYEGNATPHYNVMHTISEFHTEVDYYEYDPEKAKQLLAEAGYPNGFKTTIYSSNGTVQKAVASVIQAQLAEIGIDAEVQSLEVATFNAGVAHGGTFPIAVDGWGGHAIGPDYTLRSAFHSTGNINRSNIEDEYIDNLIDTALATGDFEARAEMYTEIQQYVMENANWIPLAIEQINIGVRADLQGFERPHGLFHHWDNLHIVEN